MISSSGNDGHGYGSISIPAASPFVTTVGATTSNSYVGYGKISGQPRFGNSTSDGGDIAHFVKSWACIIAIQNQHIIEATGVIAFAYHCLCN